MLTISFIKFKVLLIWLRCIQMAYGSTDSKCINGTYTTTSTTEGRPEVDIQVLNENIYVDDHVVFTCKVRANPAAEIFWLYEGHYITNYKQKASYIYSNCNTTLSINFAEYRDSGRYRCMARNSYGKTTSKSITLAVQLKDKFEAQYNSSSIETIPSRLCDLKHQNVTLLCKHKDSQGICIWKKNKQRVNKEKISYCDDKMCCLRIMGFSEDDAGQYTCFMYSKPRKADVIIPPQTGKSTDCNPEDDDEQSDKDNQNNSAGKPWMPNYHIGIWCYGIIALTMKEFFG